jgi:hypothetical protein
MSAGRIHPCRALLLAGALLATPVALGAQVRLAAAGPGPRRGPGDGKDPALAPSVRITIPPRAYRVAAVAVPVSIPVGRTVSYEVIEIGPFSIIGSLHGVIPARDAARTVLLTIGVPAHTLAGRMRAGVVRFHAGSTVVDVPVDVDVDAIHHLVVTVPHQLTGAVPGDRVPVPVRIVNNGNLPDTVTLDVVPPPGWRVRQVPDDHPFVVPVAGVVTRVVRLSVPRNASLGSFIARIRTSSGGENRSDDLVYLDVGSEPGGGGATGPILRTALSGTSQEGGSTARVLGVSLSGTLTNDVHVEARATGSSGSIGLAQRGLLRVGVYPMPAFLSLSAPKWSAEAGSAGVDFSELTGTNGWGRGFSFRYADSGRVVNLLAARTTAARPGEMVGRMTGTTLGLPVLGGAISGTVVDLTEGDSIWGRRLSAGGLGLAGPTTRLGKLSGEMAYRDFGTGHGLGWATLLNHEGVAANYALQLVHAPGGSSAFARARDEWSANIERQLLPHWRMGASALQARDSNAAFRSFEAASYSVSEQFELGTGTFATLEARSSRNTATPQAGNTSYGNSERLLAVRLAAQSGALSLSTDLSGSWLTRDLDFGDGLSSSTGGAHVSWTTGLGWTGRAGVYRLETGYDRSAQGSGYLPYQATVRLEADQVPLAFLSHALFLNGEVLHTRWGTYRRSITSVRGGATLRLSRELELALDAERNPFFRNAAGVVPWLVALKFEQAIQLPRLRMGGTTGVIYQDLDGNGKRDPEEPGLSGVTLSREGVKARTGHDGRYRFLDRARGPIRLDASTLPDGWVPEDGVESVVGGDIAVVTTSSVEVALQIRPDSLGRLPQVNLAATIVFARDRQGREWEARRPAPDVAIFDALPIGDYSIVVDGSQLTEPLRAAEQPLVQVRGRAQHITLPLVGRPIRFFPNGAGSTPGGHK